MYSFELMIIGSQHGVMEYWNTGVMDRPLGSRLPTLQYPITPTLLLPERSEGAVT